MAYDKAVDSAALDAGLTAIANAIREKAGSSDVLAFPTAMVDAIAAIESGGGGVATGTITPTSSSAITVEHGLGNIPSLIVFFATNTQVTTKWKQMLVVGSVINDEFVQHEIYGYGGTNMTMSVNSFFSDMRTMANNSIVYVTDSTFNITCKEGEVQAGTTYRWVVA